jgi:hypothetical protein
MSSACKIIFLLLPVMSLGCGHTIRTACIELFSYRVPYPIKSVVGIEIRGDSRFTKQLDLFSKGIVTKLQAFSIENGDFSVALPDSQGNLPDSTTHAITISIDSMRLVDYADYKMTIASIDSVAYVIGDVSANMSKWFSPRPIQLNRLGSKPSGVAMASEITGWAIKAASHPSMIANVALLSLDGSTAIWKYSRKIDNLSPVALSTEEQVAELFGNLRNQLEQSLPYFKVKK